MNYSKPEISSLAPASSVIQGSPKQVTTTQDSQLEPHYVTLTAYESDE